MIHSIKCLRKSRKIPTIHSPLFRASVILSTSSSSVIYVDFPLWKPNWFLYNRSLLVTNMESLFHMSLSISLKSTGSIQTMSSSPDLYIDTTCAVFNCWGNAVLKDEFHIWVRGFTIVFNSFHKDWFRLVQSSRTVFKTGNASYIHYFHDNCIPWDLYDAWEYFVSFEPTLTKTKNYQKFVSHLW